jgi:DNA polymerase-1
MSIPFITYRKHRWYIEREMDILRAIAQLLSGPALKIGHNLVFDFLSIIDEWKINIRPPYYCTQTAHNRCYPDLSDKRLKKLKLNSLATCTAIYTREPYYKEDYKSENEDSPTWKGSEQEFMLYNAKDAVVAFEIQEATWRDLQTFNQAELFQKDMEIFEPLGYMGLRGVLRDREKLSILQHEVQEKIIDLQKEINTIAGCHLNIGSSQQVAKVLYTQRGNKIQFDPKTKRPTTDEAAMAKLRRVSQDPLIPLIIYMRRFSKFDSTYAQALISEDDRTRTTYNQTRTTTFRISSSDSVIGGGMNLQNIPSRPRPGEEDYNKWVREFKQTFIADPGNLMARRDYIQAEAMVVAWMADDAGTIQDFETLVDIHSRTAEQLFNLPYSQIRSGYLGGNPEMKMKRYFGKKCRHAFNYKMGKRRLKEEFWKEGVAIEERDCERMLQALTAANPRTTHWWKEVEDQLRATRVITTPWGRRRFFMGIITDDTVREAIAFGPQSTVADLLNMALRRIWQTIPHEIDLLLQIHDALVFQAPENFIHNLAKTVEDLMLIPLTIKERTLTIPSDLAIGPSWGELK